MIVTSARRRCLFVCIGVLLGCCTARAQESLDLTTPTLVHKYRASNLNQDAKQVFFEAAGFGRDGHIVFATSDGAIWEIRLESGDARKLIQIPGADCWQVTRNDRSKSLLFCSCYGHCVCLSTETGEIRWSTKLRGGIGAMDVSADGTLFAAVDRQRGDTVVIRSMDDRREIGRYVSDSVNIWDVAFSADSTLVAVTAHRGADILGSQRPHKAIARVRAGKVVTRVVSFAGNGDSERLVLLTSGVVRLYNTKTWEEDGDGIEIEKVDGDEIGVTKSTDGDLLVFRTRPIRNFRLAKQKPALLFFDVPNRELIRPEIDAPREDLLLSVDISQSGDLLLAQDLWEIRIWRMQSRKAKSPK